MSPVYMVLGMILGATVVVLVVQLATSRSTLRYFESAALVTSVAFVASAMSLWT